MKDMINERLILLATAQERMSDLTDKLEHWEGSLSCMEKCSFEAINTSDKVLCMARSGRKLVDQLLETNLNSYCALDSNERAKLEELKKLFQNIMEASADNNDISHKIEAETESQKEIMGNIKKSLGTIRESVDSATACAEFILAEM